jgi:hypothetical protein
MYRLVSDLSTLARHLTSAGNQSLHIYPCPAPL